MRESRWPGVLVVAFASLAMAMAGCQSGPSRKTLASAEPALSPPVDGGTSIAAAPAPGTTSPRPLTFVERHPLFYKPRDYYESSGDNTVVKSAAAVVVGVPAGIFGELRQIVVGAPTDPRY
jgi:hypothetical protein